MMHIKAFSQGKSVPSSRFRIEDYTLPLKQKDITKDVNSLYYLSNGKMLSEFNKQRLINIKKLSIIISRINNIVLFS